MPKLVHTLFLTLQLTKIVCGFSWNAQKALHPHRAAYDGQTDEIDAAPPPRYRFKSDNIYSVALQELESLESQPLCHRIAARLLVNNCHLLHGQDETVELANTGRLTRDFIDSYAAGLAICDLERGSFVIPRECAKFREPALTKIEVGKTPYLHVSTVEIDKCLEGLAQSDSSWNTWISYRHKAVRFCEVAKSDNDKGEIAGLTISAAQAIKTDTSSPFIHTSLPNIFKTTFNDTTQMIHEAHDLQTAH
ncbi:hypothetical protein MY5147_001300 [Beauveria neobassiana]